MLNHFVGRGLKSDTETTKGVLRHILINSAGVGLLLLTIEVHFSQFFFHTYFDLFCSVNSC